jgi:hypothetical protein
MVLLIAGPGAVASATQVIPNRTSAYLHPTDVADARAAWINPAGLAGRSFASIYLDVSVREPAASGRLSQITAGFNSRGLGFSYQQDRFEEGLVGHTYRLGIAGGEDNLSAGVVAAYYRGASRATAWDAGITYDMGRVVTVGGVITNIGQPVIRGTRLPATFLPGVSLSHSGLVLSGHASITRDSVVRYAAGVRLDVPRLPISLLARLDTDRKLRRAAFAFGLSVGRRDLLGTIVTTPGDVSVVDAASLYGMLVRSLDR